MTSRKQDKHANLLLVQSSAHVVRNHFVCIRNLSRLVSSQNKKKEDKRYICNRCLHYFGCEEKLAVQTIDCKRINDCAVKLPTEDNKWLCFKNFSYKERTPFIVYADFECLLRTVVPEEEEEEEEEGRDGRQLYQDHRVFSAGYYVYCSYDASLPLHQYRLHRNESDCIDLVVKELRNLGHRLDSILRKVVPMKQFTAEECNEYYKAAVCHICEKPFLNSDDDDCCVMRPFPNSLVGVTP